MAAGDQGLLIFRTDGHARIGLGHIMRCLALAQAWQAVGGKVLFAVAGEESARAAMQVAPGFEVASLDVSLGGPEDLARTVDLALTRKALRVVVDGYHFDAAYQEGLKNAGLQVLFIDDFGHADHYRSDWVLNQNIYGDASMYPSLAPHTRLLLGPRYFLLREEFWAWASRPREMPAQARKVLVTLGGSDPQNATLKVVSALRRVEWPGLEAMVVAGAVNSQVKELAASLKEAPFPGRVEQNAGNMAELMRWADVAIAAGGITCYELAFMGVPTLMLILADNQRLNGEFFESRGVAVNLGGFADLDLSKTAASLTELLGAAGKRAEMSRRGRNLVDGQGVWRVLNHLGLETITLRAAVKDDCRMLWEWANDPEVRKNSFSSDPIPWEQHVSWFESKLRDPGYLFFIVL
ncbi:MAG: UDP-2,4-diacetamido-2,4,6-trideoxy-beta-L-altropyranose hydrolase, partial [Deltaproteobacteria bacterium]|nr:UDP-2,4-diacetamido-2,4,6-trideoxy-beta-L-altropyranose hydrolase [Deltaproteobacteria bacterium]